MKLSGLGDRLKETRKARGYSLDDLQAITKIQKRYLAGIENEDYSTMPGLFYVRAFIKKYAEAVGLDAQEMLSLYHENESSVQMKEEEVQRSAPQMTQKTGYIKSGNMNDMLPKIIAALFVIVTLSVVVFLYQHQANTQEPEEAETSNGITLDKQNPEGSKEDEIVLEDEENQEEPEELVLEQTLTEASVSGATATFTLDNAENFNVSIKVKDGGESWVGVTSPSGEELLTKGARVMKAGEVEELELTEQESARIRVGRTQFTEILVNGEPLTYPNDTVTQNIIIEYKK